MRTNDFTRRILQTMSLIVIGSTFALAQNDGTGTGWNTLNPTSPLILNEDFTGFEFYGNWIHTNNSNSKDKVDEVTGVVTPANIGGTKTITFIESTKEVTYTWDSCAFAPEWGVAGSVDGDGIPVDPNPATPGISNGFVEIARNGYGTRQGDFTIDLRNADFIEAVQYSHSSCGGKRRGFVLLFSVDDAQSWDTLRLQLGDHWSLNYTKDPFTREKTPNDFNCTPSANGMLWEDAIYMENVMLKFTSDTIENQAVRIHDLKIFGELPSEVGITKNQDESFRIIFRNNLANLSDEADMTVYSLNGRMVKRALDVRSLSLADVPDGVYIIKAQKGNKLTAKKVVKK
ncbi:MAG TPA: T9SS type A sorting domain-containing protein [Prolixibacteraceae bacterium]|nr:T9SS type A sorting domain-containing protein [Prolixibacteraceae bacterium]